MFPTAVRQAVFTSGLRSRVGFSHSRFRFAPTALVRRWPRHVPSGFMLGTCRSGIQRLRKVRLPSSRGR